MKKKTLVFVAAVATAIGLTVGAYAYFTSSGSGDGSATVGSSAAVTIIPTISNTTLYPGGPAASVSFKVKNNGAGNEYVNSISYNSLNSPPSGCLSGWFHLNNDVAVPVGLDVDPGATVDVPGGPFDLKMADVNASQDACAGATLSFHFTSN